MSQYTAPAMTDHIAIRPVAGRIGAELSGIRLSGDLSAAQVTTVRNALLAHKVVFFRDQHHLDDAEQERFSALLGDLQLHPTLQTHGTSRAILNVASDGAHAANTWHTDTTYLPSYPAASILRAVHLPPRGGDTIWCNTASAYADLSAPVRALADELWGLHSNSHDFSARRMKAGPSHEGAPATIYETEHPVVRVHPETGERTLVMGTFMARILGVSREESFHIQQMLQSHINRPENTVRWSWRLGDVAIWDNRATQHYGIGDFTERRELHRVTIRGDVPVSISGEQSRAVQR
jgi:taurine dioxygenase